MTARIFVSFTHAGMHCWPDAPDARAYLRDLHRHLFYVRVETDVEHDDREIEFHDLLGEAREHFEDAMTVAPRYRSCEMMARHLAMILCHAYKRPFTVTVSEDNECGASVTYAPDGD